MYRQKEGFNVAMKLHKPTLENVAGRRGKTYTFIDMIYGTFKTYGGTERTINNVYAIEDTAEVVTWYRPDIASNCMIELEDGRRYDIISEPENIDMRNQFCKFKVKRIKGDA